MTDTTPKTGGPANSDQPDGRLDSEEQEILTAYEDGKTRSVTNAAVLMEQHHGEPATKQ